MVGEDRAGMNMPTALMKAVNKFQGYEHVKVSLDVTPRGTGISGTSLRNSLKNDTPEKALATWSNAFDVKKLGVDWIKHLMDITKQGMGIPQAPVQQPEPVAESRLFNTLIRPSIIETARKSAAVKLSNAWNQQQQKSAASRERAEQAKAEFEKEWKAKQEKEKSTSEGAPIVVALPPIDVRNPKPNPTKVRYQGDIVPDTKPPSTEKRGVKGRPGQRPMPDHSVEEDKIKGVDGKACWKGKRYAGKVKKADGTYKDKCVPVSEDVENIIDTLINKIIMNEAVQNNKR
jgi:hypothetical protein